MLTRVCSFLASLSFFVAVAAAAEQPIADVVVYGGTSAGVTAAVEAARMRRRVVLIEPGRHLGGMSSSGLGMTDNGSTATIGGLSREFYQRVYRYYTDPKAWKQLTREEFLVWMPPTWGIDGPRMEAIKAQYLFEPHAAEQVFNDMAREAGVEVVYGERLDLKNGVMRDGTKIVSIRMESGREFAGRTFIDATYEGDLMAKAGVKYIVGREPNSLYDETLNGVFPFTPAPFPKISPYVAPGDPKSGLLPRVEPRPPGVKGQGDRRVQAYNFRICLTDIPENRVPFVKPANYNPLDYELLARLIATMKDVQPGPRRAAAMGLRGKGLDLGINFELVPNRKTDSNCGSEFGSDMFGRSYDWPEADYAGRQRIWEEHKSYTQGLLWFLANDPRIPQPVRDEMQRWGLAKDEFTDNDNWPHQLYVREARRMISDYVVTEHEAKGEHPAADSVAIASYPLDSHGVTLYVDETGLLHRERGFYVGTKPFAVSYRAIRPRAEECTNLLVPGCLSASHAAYGSIRMEPVFMMLGHASGAAAALASERNVAVQDVPYEALRSRLLSAGQILEYATPKASPPQSLSPQAPDALEPSINADLKNLADRKIIDSAETWSAYLKKGGQCPGEAVAAMLLKMAQSLKPETKDLAEAVTILQEQGVISSSKYWQQYAIAGKTCSNEYVSKVIRNFVSVSKP
jgi:hypothetical protein